MQPLNSSRSSSSGSSKSARSGMGARRHVASHLDHHLDPLSLSTYFALPLRSQECVDPIELSPVRLRILSIGADPIDQVDSQVSYRVTDRAQSTHRLLANLVPSVKHHDVHIGPALCRDRKLRCSRDAARRTAPRTWVPEKSRHLVSLVESRGSVRPPAAQTPPLA